MSDYASIAERARKAFASVSKLEAAYKNDPQDRALQMNLKSMRRLAEKERIALEEAAARPFDTEGVVLPGYARRDGWVVKDCVAKDWVGIPLGERGPRKMIAADIGVIECLRSAE